MNISEDTIVALNELFQIGFYSDGIREVAPESATQLSLGWQKDPNGEVEYLGKWIKTPKAKEVTVEWVLSKLDQNATFVNFAPQFAKFLRANGHTNFGAIYPTTYGIGVFVAIGGDRGVIPKIAEILKENQIEFSNEYSDAAWVYRFKISKSAKNIDTLNQFIEKNK